ncbi:phosphatase PAP2 family protein [Acinetobacter dispersus]|uniref:phosphatase PAP2 family protein n=1 Tax=Acinetobacter dispersus TaxID=70348 RepID=UPI00132EAA8C|nr:phosphatase PAP2 family protein [Acinetobacter dispersus]MCH7390478.1 phosphatase PAP2 family protein [Acinetobacter dispersus]MCU4338493.1 phosphatase PAP2 family protein [Acinetobacter dispersus]QHH99428.1 phosphatase PAP2 family protein [Acinetobacter dispersus]
MILKTPFFLWLSFLLFISFFILLFVFPVGGAIDLHLIQPWVSTHGTFPYKNDWFLDKLNHTYVKQLLTVVYVIFFFLWCASFKLEKLKPNRWLYGYMFWVSMLCTCIVGLLKAHSYHACPWYMTHETATGFVWDFSATAGHCFPGGHASTGFALITGFFVYHLHQTQRAWFYLIAGMILGFAMGWAQMMRGAHFLSHNLWTAWVCVAINLLCYALTYKHHQDVTNRNSSTVSNI